MKKILIAVLVLGGLASSRAEAAPSASDAAFWKWFGANAPAVGKMKVANEPIADRLAAELHKVDPKLTFEIGIGMKPHELIISADGLVEVFPVVQRLVAAAPTVAGWKIIAFRPRKGMSEVQLGDGTKLKMTDMMFVAADHGPKLDVTIYISGRPIVDNPVKTAVYLLLDSALGEYDVETRLAGIDMLGSAPPKTARPLSQLAAAVDAKKK